MGKKENIQQHYKQMLMEPHIKLLVRVIKIENMLLHIYLKKYLKILVIIFIKKI